MHHLVHAQPYYNQRPEFLKANSQWAFGSKAGLDFNSSPPLPFLSQTVAVEGAASVADPQTGDLLFYWAFDHPRGKANLFNAGHQPMPNAVHLGSNGSTTQGCLIVPMIDSPGKYYVFSLYGPTDERNYPQPFVGTLFYSVVDMTLENGLGNVVSGQKNVLLDADTLSESMIAIPGNNCDLWLMVHSYKHPKFKAYHITGAGIDPNPVISIAGEQIQGGANMPGGGTRFAYNAGGMAVSPDRQTLAITSAVGSFDQTPGIGGTLLCQFDPETGLVSNAIQLEDSYDGIQMSYVPAFSPDNNKLYLSIFNNDSATHKLQQYTISNYDSTAIANSKTTIHSFGNTLIGSPSLKLYRDTIYIKEGRLKLTLSTINQPNLDGTACDYQANSIPLGLVGATTDVGELPNEVAYPSPRDTVFRTIMDTLICSGWTNGIELHPAEVVDNYTYTWNDNSLDTVRTIFSEGIYWVHYGDGCHSKVDTFRVMGSDLAPPVITINVHELSTTMSNYDSYQWLLNGQILPGATQSAYTVLENGAYQVIVSNNQGCVDTSEVYEVNNVSIQNLGDIGTSIQIWPNPVQEVVYVRAPVPVQISLSSISGKLIQPQSKTRSLSMRDLAVGMYLLRIMDRNGRLLKAEKLIKVKQ